MSVAKKEVDRGKLENQTKDKAEPKTFYDRDTMP